MYQFRREDNGQTIEVDFETMMGQDAGGYITVEIDGQRVTAKRIHDGAPFTPSAPSPPPAAPPPAVSDMAFACPDFQVDEMRENARLHGFHVEWKPERDFADTGFYAAHFSSSAEMERYRKFCGLPDKNGSNGSGGGISLEQLTRARQLARRAF